jgi:hypothetical protein
MHVLLATALTIPLLRAADVDVAMTSPTTCNVTLKLTIEGAEEIDHRVDAAAIELLDVSGAQTVGEIRTIGRTRSLILRPLRTTYQIRYHAILSTAREFRCPLWLPTIPTDGQSRAVNLHVTIPTGAMPSDSMPMLLWNERSGEAALGHLPAFVHVPFTAQGVAVPWSVSQTMDTVTIALIVGASLIWAWWRKR